LKLFINRAVVSIKALHDSPEAIAVRAIAQDNVHGYLVSINDVGNPQRSARDKTGKVATLASQENIRYGHNLSALG